MGLLAQARDGEYPPVSRILEKVEFMRYAVVVLAFFVVAARADEPRPKIAERLARA